MPAAKPKLIYSLICDDIRQEIGNKMSLMGVYQSDILIPEFPFTFPKLCFYLCWANVKEGGEVSVTFRNPSGDDLGNIKKFSLPDEIKKKKNKFIMSAGFGGLKLKEEGDYELVIVFDYDGEKYEERIKIKISLPPQK